MCISYEGDWAKSVRVIFKTTRIFVLCVYVRYLTLSGPKAMSYPNHSIICKSDNCLPVP